MGCEREVADRAGQAAFDQIALVTQVIQRARRAAGVGVVKHAIDKTLALDQGVAAIAAATAPHGIAHFVAKGAYAIARHKSLGGLLKACAVDHTAKVPALTQQLHLAPGSGGHLGLEVFHHGAGLKAHQVEAERADLVVPRPGDGGINHQLAHHQVLSGGVFAAGVFEDGAVVVQAVVVARHHTV